MKKAIICTDGLFREFVPLSPGKPAEPEAPSTGDINIALIALLAAASLFGIAVAIEKKS